MIIAEFDQNTGIVEAGAGYEDISSFRVADLKKILERINPDYDEVRLAHIPYMKDGRRIGSALLVKVKGIKPKADPPHWIYVTPIKEGKDKKRYPVPIGEIIYEEES